MCTSSTCPVGVRCCLARFYLSPHDCRYTQPRQHSGKTRCCTFHLTGSYCLTGRLHPKFVLASEYNHPGHWTRGIVRISMRYALLIYAQAVLLPLARILRLGLRWLSGGVHTRVHYCKQTSQDRAILKRSEPHTLSRKKIVVNGKLIEVQQGLIHGRIRRPTFPEMRK